MGAAPSRLTRRRRQEQDHSASNPEKLKPDILSSKSEISKSPRRRRRAAVGRLLCGWSGKRPPSPTDDQIDRNAEHASEEKFASEEKTTTFDDVCEVATVDLNSVTNNNDGAADGGVSRGSKKSEQRASQGKPIDPSLSAATFVLTALKPRPSIKDETKGKDAEKDCETKRKGSLDTSFTELNKKHNEEMNKERQSVRRSLSNRTSNKDSNSDELTQEFLMQIIRCFPFPSPKPSPKSSPKLAKRDRIAHRRVKSFNFRSRRINSDKTKKLPAKDSPVKVKAKELEDASGISSGAEENNNSALRRLAQVHFLLILFALPSVFSRAISSINYLLFLEKFV